jgi:hypothetical protein
VFFARIAFFARISFLDFFNFTAYVSGGKYAHPIRCEKIREIFVLFCAFAPRRALCGVARIQWAQVKKNSFTCGQNEKKIFTLKTTEMEVIDLIFLTVIVSISKSPNVKIFFFNFRMCGFHSSYPRPFFLLGKLTRENWNLKTLLVTSSLERGGSIWGGASKRRKQERKGVSRYERTEKSYT